MSTIVGWGGVGRKGMGEDTSTVFTNALGGRAGLGGEGEGQHGLSPHSPLTPTGSEQHQGSQGCLSTPNQPWPLCSHAQCTYPQDREATPRHRLAVPTVTRGPGQPSISGLHSCRVPGQCHFFVCAFE